MWDERGIFNVSNVDIEERRLEMIDNVKSAMSEFETTYGNDKEIADKVEKICEECDLLSKIGDLNALAFIQVDIANKDNSNQMFGDISKAVADAVGKEVYDIMNTNENNVAAQITPNLLRNNVDIKIGKIIRDNIFNMESENVEKDLMAIRCMVLYSEMAQTATNISDKTNEKINENNKILALIGVSPKPNPEFSESQLTEVVSYTFAVVSNIQDGTVPDVNYYKDKVVDLINSGIKNVINSDDFKVTLNSFSDVANTLASCSDQIVGNQKGRAFAMAMNAVEAICKEKSAEIGHLFEDNLAK